MMACHSTEWYGNIRTKNTTDSDDSDIDDDDDDDDDDNDTDIDDDNDEDDDDDDDDNLYHRMGHNYSVMMMIITIPII